MADRYLVATGTWSASNTLIWAATDGGVPGASVPTSSDNVFYTLLSGALTITIATNDANCLNLDCTGAIGTLAGSTTALNIYGSSTISSGMTFSFTGALNYLSTSSGKTIAWNGKTTNSAVVFNGVGGAWTLQDNWNNSAAAITLSNGSFDTNNKTITCGIFTPTTGSLTLGASSIINCSNWVASSTSTFTLTANATSKISITNIGTFTFQTGNQTYGEFDFNIASVATWGGVSAAIFDKFVVINTSGNAGATRLIFLAGGSTFTVNSALTLTGLNNAGGRLSFGRQINSAMVYNGSTTSITNVDFRMIAVTGTGTPLTGTSVGNAGLVSGVTFTSPVTRYWVHPATASQTIYDANWSASSGGATGSSFPIPQDQANFDSKSFSASGKTVTSANPNMWSKTSFVGVTNSPTITPTASVFLDDFILDAGLTWSPVTIETFLGVNDCTLTSAGKTHIATTFNNQNKIRTLSDNFTSTGAIIVAAGTLEASTFNVSLSGLSYSFTNAVSAITIVANMGSGTWIASGSGTIWDDTYSSCTINAGTSTIKLTNSSASSKTFTGGRTYNNFWNATGSSGVVIMNGSSTFNDFKIDAGRTQQFIAATNTTFSSLTATGAVANLITIQSTTAATHTLTHVVTSLANRFVSCDYLSIDHSIALPTKTFYAGANSVDNGSNTGWIFTAAPAANLKTFNGIPIASIKSINGIAASAIKSVNGVT